MPHEFGMPFPSIAPLEARLDDPDGGTLTPGPHVLGAGCYGTHGNEQGHQLVGRQPHGIPVFAGQWR